MLLALLTFWGCSGKSATPPFPKTQDGYYFVSDRTLGYLVSFQFPEAYSNITEPHIIQIFGVCTKGLTYSFRAHYPSRPVNGFWVDPAKLEMYVFDGNVNNRNAKTLADSRMKWEHDRGDFTLIGWGTTTVSGIPAISFEVTRAHEMGFLGVNPQGEKAAFPRKWAKHVFFDYKGLVWEIEAYCEEEMTAQVRKDFDDFVASFKIAP